VTSFRYTKRFEDSAKGIFSEEDLRELELYLVANPEAGSVIKGGHGLRKLRFGACGRGTRGGARVIYLRIVSESLIVLADCYAKNNKENISASEIKNLNRDANES